MRINSIIAAAAAALFLTPAVALAGGPNTDHPGKGQAKREARADARGQDQTNAEAGTEGKANAPAVPPSQARGYGKLCHDQSKKHVKGKKGTPFSRCVKAARKLEAEPEADTGSSDESYADPFGND